MPKLSVILEGNILGVVTSLDMVESYFYKHGTDPTPNHDDLWPLHTRDRWRWDPAIGLYSIAEYLTTDKEKLDKIITHLNKKWNIPREHSSLIAKSL